MIVDSSAVVSVILDEPDAAAFARAMAQTVDLHMSAANWLETAMVVDNRANPVFESRFQTILSEMRLQIVPVTLEHAAAARITHRNYGRGNHPAKLNYGDCFAYALAKITGEPLLFKGSDFSQTDITPALGS